MARTKWGLRYPNAASQNAAPAPPPSDPPTSADSKKFGLENFGNTCYANSVIQALYFCVPFRELLLQQPDNSIPLAPPLPIDLPPPAQPEPSAALAPVRRKPERKQSTATGAAAAANAAPTQPPVPPIPSSPATLFSALRSLFHHISTHPSEKGSVAPRAFIEKLKDLNESFRSTMHQDAHEFLNYLLNRIVEEVEEDKRQRLPAPGANGNGDDLASSIGTLPNATISTNSSNSGTSPQDATLVHRLFEGVLTSETRCLSCETVSSRDESFLDLSIDIEQNSSVTACLRQFSASEMLCRGNKFSCDACGGLQEAEKRMKIKKLPNVLALHLKRFKYQEDVQKYIKLSYRVAFPFELRLFNTVDDTEDADRLYNLFAIVVHIGAGPHQGHYISIIKTLGSWFVFDDENVTSISEADIPKYFGEANAGSAYVLYYQAVDIDLVELGLREPTPPPPEPIPIPVADTIEANQLEAAEESSSTSPLISPLLGKPSTSSSSALQITVPESASSHTSSTSGSVVPAAPPTPTGKSKGFFGGLRRTPSSTAGKGLASSPTLPPPVPKLMNGTAHEKGPRLRASSPALSQKISRESPPPLPSSPALAQPSRSIGSPYTHLINGKDKPKKEKEPERKNGGGWFTTKRKSFRALDKDKEKDKDRPQTASKGSSVEDHSPTHWYSREKHSKHEPRRPSETGIVVDQIVNGAVPIPRPKSAATPMNYHQFTPMSDPQQYHHGSNGYETLTSESASYASSPYSTLGQESEMSPASSPNGPLLEFPPTRKSSLAQESDSYGHRPSTGHSKTRPKLPPTPTHAQRPSTAGASFAPNRRSDRQLPPIPSAPSSPTQEVPQYAGALSNKNVFSAEPESTEVDSTYSGVPSATNLLRHDTPPPGSVSSSAAGHSTLTNYSSSTKSGTKRTSRKLSFTAPVGGLFGWKDKDKAQREKAPSSFSRHS